MLSRRSLFILFLLSVSLCLSCAMASKRLTGEFHQMHDLLTTRSQSDCPQYLYNAKREIPRLYSQNQTDSILDIIDYITEECGPNPHLSSTQLLVRIGQGKYGDSLIGQGTIGQLLWFRAERDYGIFLDEYRNLLARDYPVDNNAEQFSRFLKDDLATYASTGAGRDPAAQALVLGFAGNFDSAFSLIQKKEMNGTGLQDAYYSYVDKVNRNLPGSGHVSMSVGGWNPQGENRVLGSHPDITFAIGGEAKSWRADIIFSVRTGSIEDPITVVFDDSTLTTKDFSAYLIGMEAGLKIFDQWLLSTDIFAGLGYDILYTYQRDEEYKTHGSPNASIGLRQRIFLGKTTGWYIGGTARYSLLDYGNSGGTDLSGNSATLALTIGWAGNVTRNEFYDKLNYQGRRRP